MRTQIRALISLFCLVPVFGFCLPAAEGETLVFDAEAAGKILKPEGCPEGALACTPVTIIGLGTGEFRFFLEAIQGEPDACPGPNGPTAGGAYMARVAFILPDGSTLLLSESGLVCGPGFSLTAPGGAVSFGNPVEGNGKWRVQSATGRFSGFSGEGVDEFRSMGASFGASYTGTLSR